MFVVDTNILVYAARKDFTEHETCRTLVEEWRQGQLPWFITWSIVYELLRITTHPKILKPPLSLDEAWAFVDSLLAAPGLEVLTQTKRHARIASRTWEEFPDLQGNVLHDAHTAILMREHGIRQRRRFRSSRHPLRTVGTA